MPSQTQSQRNEDLTIADKMKIVQYLAIFPALTIMVFMRRKVGFRMLKPTRIIGMAFFLSVVDDMVNMLPLVKSTGVVFTEFPMVLMIAGFSQRYLRWKELCRGERWHTLSTGVSYLELLPLPAILKSHRRIYRFLDPIAVFIFAMFFGSFVSMYLARWFAFSALCLFIFEQTLYEKQLDRDLDILDGLVAAEVQSETVEHFAGSQPAQQERTLQDTAGIPTGVAFDIHRQIEIRRAAIKEAERLSKEPQPVKPFVQVNLTPAPEKPAALAPPDNMAKDEPNNPA